MGWCKAAKGLLVQITGKVQIITCAAPIMNSSITNQSTLDYAMNSILPLIAFICNYGHPYSYKLRDPTQGLKGFVLWKFHPNIF